MTADPRDKMALSELLSTVPPGHRDQPWTWDDEERNLRLRLCLCCGKPGHHQQVIEERIRQSGVVPPVCIGEDGKLHDGHHRVIAAKTLGIPDIPLEPRAEADERSRQDHGSYVWELRRFGDANPGGEYDHIQYVRQAARDFVEWEKGR